MRICAGAAVRAAFAHHLLGGTAKATTLGDVALHRHQREGLDRIRQLVERYGGALLGDEAGLGKTFVALALARDARQAVVVAPAAIRDAWSAAAGRTGVPVQFVSMESLSRGAGPEVEPDLVIVDEAHHLRSRSTNRFALASALCRRARVLLLSATPVQNSVRDLRTLLSLFLGANAHAMSVDELGRYVVRRIAGGIGDSTAVRLPRVETPQWLGPIGDVDCLDRLLRLPRAVPPADGDDGGLLLTYTLVRQWSSSRAALRAALQRRLARARAIEDSLLAGRLPSRAELSSWSFADGAQQLAFPELTAAMVVPECEALLEQVRSHTAGVRQLLEWLDTAPDPDLARADALRDVLRRHPAERVVAFSEYADTVTALYRAMAPGGRVAALHHGGGRIASGPIGRRDVLARFAPGASARMPAGEQIDLLLTTDVLSEGVDLHDASVVVHIDLAWNPARLEQRVGRLRRLGASRDAVYVYVMGPPAPAERLLRLEQRLRLKLGTAARAIGVAGAILPGVALETNEASAPREERLAALLRTWHPGETPPGHVAATVNAAHNGALAAVRLGGDVALLAVIEGRVTDERSAVVAMAESAAGDDRETDPSELARVRQTIEAWLRRRLVSDVVDLPALRVAHARRALLRRVEIISRRTPRHAQPTLAPLMRAARATAAAVLSAGAERVLEEIAGSPMDDVAWLQAIGEFAALHAKGRCNTPPEILALLILRQR